MARNALNVTIKEAALFMSVGPQFVRVGIQQGILPFGTAVKINGERYTYYISPSKLAEYVGIDVEALFEWLREIRSPERREFERTFRMKGV